MKSALKALIKIMDKISLWAISLSVISIVLIMLVEVINALGRKFATPFPCALELAVSLMITTVFFAAPRVASLEEHTFVTLTTRNLPPVIKRLMDLFGFMLGFVVFGIVAAGAWEAAYRSVITFEMRIGVFRFPIWPFRILFSFGLSMLSLQLLLNALRSFFQMSEHDYPSEYD